MQQNIVVLPQMEPPIDPAYISYFCIPIEEPVWVTNTLSVDPIYLIFLITICRLNRMESALFMAATAMQQYESIFAMCHFTWNDWQTRLAERDYQTSTARHVTSCPPDLDLVQLRADVRIVFGVLLMSTSSAAHRWYGLPCGHNSDGIRAWHALSSIYDERAPTLDFSRND
jgi:hypothetical protein